MKRIRIEKPKVRRERSSLEALALDPRDPTSFDPRPSIAPAIDAWTRQGDERKEV